MKADGSIRICADYKSTINRALQANPYPVPVVQHVLHSFGQGRIFAKLDMAQAYQQLPVDEASTNAQTAVTHRGAFRCRRLQFGMCVAPGIFQCLMEHLLHGLDGVVPYFDDILIAAANQSELVVKLWAILDCFRNAGLRLKWSKCQIGVPSVEFLGFRIDGQGIHPTLGKLEAIHKASTSTNRNELQAFLGLINFYVMFLPHKVSVAEPLHRLLDSSVTWCWGAHEAQAFSAVKSLLSSSAVLVQYSERLPLTLTCNTLPYGIGVVLAHILPSGQEAPIAYFLCTLPTTEKITVRSIRRRW